MKSNAFTLLFSIIAVALFSCEDDQMDASNCNLSNIICTEEFKTITLEITNQNGEAVMLDEFYTFIDSRNKIDTLSNDGFKNGVYPVVTDSQEKEFQEENTIVIFVGVKDGRNLVEHEMVIKSDCCHIGLVEGDTSITIEE